MSLLVNSLTPIDPDPQARACTLRVFQKRKKVLKRFVNAYEKTFSYRIRNLLYITIYLYNI